MSKCFFFVTTPPAVQLQASLLGSLREKFSRLSAWKGSRLLVCGRAASLLGTQSRQSWIPVGACEALEGAQPPADKRCQLTAGPTHQLRVHSWLTGHIECIRSGSAPIQTVPPPLGFLLFSSYLRLCQVKGLYYDANCVESRLPGWRSRLVTVPLQCFLPLEMQQEPKHQSHACFGLFQHSEKRAGTPNWPFFNGLLLLLLSLSFWAWVAALNCTSE